MSKKPEHRNTAFSIAFFSVFIPYIYLLLFKKFRAPNDLDTLFLIYTPLFIAVVSTLVFLLHQPSKMKGLVGSMVFLAMVVFLAGFNILDSLADRIFFQIKKNKLEHLVSEFRSYDELNSLLIYNANEETYLNGCLVIDDSNLPGGSKISTQNYKELKQMLMGSGFQEIEITNDCIRLQPISFNVDWGMTFTEDDIARCLEQNENAKPVTTNWYVVRK